MKFLAVVWLSVLVVDSVVASFLLSPWFILLLPPCFAGVFFLVRMKGKVTEIETVAGWTIAEGVELSDPENTIETTVVLPLKTLNLGVVFIGGQGTGKSMSVALGYLRYLHESGHSGFVFNDGKGQKDIYQNAVASGVNFHHFFSSETQYSSTMNLMEGQTNDVIDRLSLMLISQTTTTQFYSNKQNNALRILVPVLKSLKVPVNLCDLFCLITDENAAIDVLNRAKLAGLSADKLKLADSWLSVKADQRLSTISGLLDRLFLYVTGDLSERVNAYQPTLSIHDAVENKENIFFHLPLSDISKELSIAITEMFGVESRLRQIKGGKHNFYPLIFDDWGDLFYPNFSAIAARCRSAQMPFSFGFQSVAQINKVSPDFKDEIDDTLATKIFLRLNGDATRKFAISTFGQYEAREISRNENHFGPGTSVNTQLKDRISVEEIKTLDNGEALITTVNQVEGKTGTREYRVRFPLVETDDANLVDWPYIQANEQVGGLGLWDKYMDDEKIKKKKEAIVSSALASLSALEEA